MTSLSPREVFAMIRGDRTAVKAVRERPRIDCRGQRSMALGFFQAASLRRGDSSLPKMRARWALPIAARRITPLGFGRSL